MTGLVMFLTISYFGIGLIVSVHWGFRWPDFGDYEDLIFNIIIWPLLIGQYRKL